MVYYYIPVITFYVLLGTLAGSILCFIPALHIYNVAGIAIVAWLAARHLVPYYAIAPFFMSLVVAFSFLNTIPMTFFNTIDESAGATLLPSNAMVIRGRGAEAAILSGFGTLMGAFLLIALTPFFFYIWPYLAVIFGGHLHWILGLVIVHYIMSEWPKGAGRGKTPLKRWIEACRNCFAGMLTFFLAALFGLIFITKPILPPELAFQNIMPVFVGFFAIPSIIQSLLSKFKPPEQYNPKSINADWKDFSYGLLPGFTGGMLAAYLPAVTAGIGAMLAGHITNHRNLDRARFRPPEEEGEIIHLETPEMYYRQERNFLIAGGVGKILYYVGAFLLLFTITELTPFGTGRGGLAFILRPVFSAEPGDFFVMASTIVFSGSISFLILLKGSDIAADYAPRINITIMYTIVLIALSAIVYFIAGGWIGIAIMAATSCIGMIPVFYNCRRSHCMAVLLVPIALNMAGYGENIAKLLGLV